MDKFFDINTQRNYLGKVAEVISSEETPYAIKFDIVNREPFVGQKPIAYRRTACTSEVKVGDLVLITDLSDIISDHVFIYDDLSVKKFIGLKNEDVSIDITDGSSCKITANEVEVTEGLLTVRGAASGTFVSYDGHVITVENGIVTNII
jgi:hypothetical protein